MLYSRGRTLIAAGSALTLSMLLGACGGGASTTDQSGTASSGETTIEFFQSKRESTEIVDKLIEQFESENPGITVTQTNTPDALTVLKSRLAKNDIPDVIALNVSNLNDISTAGILKDLSGTEASAAVANESAKSYISNLSGVSEEVAVPWAVNAQVVLYDKDQFEELGLEEPQTWEEFIGVADKVKAAGKDPFYFTWKDAWTAKMLSNSVAGSLQGPDFWSQLQEGTATFSDSPAWKEAGEKLLELKKYAQPDPFGKGYDDGNSAFANGDSVMYVQGTWAIPEIRATNPDKSIGAFVMPVTDNPDDTVILSGPDSVLTIAESTKNAEAAQKFVDFLMTKESQETFANDQFLFSVLADVPPADQTIAPLKTEWLDKGRVAVYPDSMVSGASNMQAIVQQFLQDEDIEAMLSALDQDYATNGIK